MRNTKIYSTLADNARLLLLSVFVTLLSSKTASAQYNGAAQSGWQLQPTSVGASIIDRYSRYYMQNHDDLKKGEVRVTFLGTTTLLFDDGETQLLLDGFFTHPSMIKVVTTKVQTDPAIVDRVLSRIKADRVQALFTAHSHYDHAFDVAYVAQKTHAKLYGSESTLNIGRGGGLSEDQMVLYQPGKKLAFGQFTVTVIPSKHSPPIPGINDDIGKIIATPLSQPASAKAYKEGGSYDFLIQHGAQSVLVKPSCNFVKGALNNIKCDVVFLGTATLGLQNKEFQKNFYEQTVRKVRPQLVIPIHWDNFFDPLTEHLNAPLIGDNLAADFDCLLARLNADKIRFGILQGYESIIIPANGK